MTVAFRVIAPSHRCGSQRDRHMYASQSLDHAASTLATSGVVQQADLRQPIFHDFGMEAVNYAGILLGSSARHGADNSVTSSKHQRTNLFLRFPRQP